jgi:hypothetical protein
VFERARLHKLLKNSWDVQARVELAFRPASEFFVFDPEPALAGRHIDIRHFSAASSAVPQQRTYREALAAEVRTFRQPCIFGVMT